MRIKVISLFDTIALANEFTCSAQTYKICQEGGNPAYLDCYTHLKTWLEYLQKHTPRQILPSDPLFPAMASTGKLKIGEQMSKTGFDRLLEQVVQESDVLDGRPGKFTTHCFRRGGCQYRFMWVENPWSLKAVKWWGGWSSNDSVGTIMRYLLDELTAYEDDYGDIMMPDRPLNRRETLMGRYAPATPSSSTEIKELKQCVQNLTQIIMQSKFLSLFNMSEHLPPTNSTGTLWYYDLDALLATYNGSKQQVSQYYRHHLSCLTQSHFQRPFRNSRLPFITQVSL